MIVKDFLKVVYTKVKQTGASASIGNDWLTIINNALYTFFDYKGYRWLWQFTIEEIPATQFKHGSMFEIETSFPIIDVHKFFELPEELCTAWLDQCKPLEEMQTRRDRCKCGSIFIAGISTAPSIYTFPGVGKDGEIDMAHRKPKSTLCNGQFQILKGQREYALRGMLPYAMKKSYKVYVEYLRGFNKLTSYNDDIQIPDNLSPVLALLVTSEIIDGMGQFRSGDGSYYYSKFERAMDMAYENQPQTMDAFKMKSY